MKAGTESKIKFQKLKNRLRLRFWEVIGVLEALWRVTQINAPAGDIGKLANDEIAAAMEWEGDPDALIDALIDARWLDKDDVFRLIIHDWSEHAPNHLVGAFRKHGKLFADQEAAARHHARAPCLAPCQGTMPSTLPPSQAKPSLTKPIHPQPRAGEHPEAGLAGGWDDLDGVARAKLVLRGCGYKRIDDLLVECQQRGQEVGDVLAACEEFRANAAKFSSPGAIAEFLRSGTWPAEGVIPIHVATQRGEAAAKRNGETQAYAIIRRGRNAKLADEDIQRELDAAGLSWPQ